MRREHILMIWAGGLILAVVLYLVGPDRFFDACLAFLDGIDAAFRGLIAELGMKTYGVIRALTIGIYVVFVVLAFLASQRGHRGLWPMLVVTVVFLMLVGHPFSDYPAPLSRWFASLALVVVGAVVMTQRLTVPPSRRHGPVPPYPPGRI